MITSRGAALTQVPGPVPQVNAFFRVARIVGEGVRDVDPFDEGEF